MEPIYETCDKSCDQRFYVQHFKKDKLHSTVEKTYFNCPNCGREYVCFYTDEEVRKLQKKQRELKRKLKWVTDDAEVKVVLTELDRLRAATKERIDAIKQEVEKQYE